MDAKLTKALQAEFHRLDAECKAVEAEIRAEQDACAPVHAEIDALRKQLDVPRERIRELADKLRPLASERSRMVKALDGKTGPKSA